MFLGYYEMPLGIYSRMEIFRIGAKSLFCYTTEVLILFLLIAHVRISSVTGINDHADKSALADSLPKIIKIGV